MNRIVLAGNPNTGKTTLFNNLTGSHEKVGNWHGVTVDKITKSSKLLNCDIVDLPGVYSLEGNTQEEKVAANFLSYLDESDIVINVLDSSCLERGVRLTKLLIEKNINTIIFINKTGTMSDRISDKIEQLTGCKVFVLDARNKRQVEKIAAKICKNKEQYIPKLQKNIDWESLCKAIISVPKLSKMDKIFMSDWFAVPIFLLIIGFVFFVTFGFIGSFISSIFTFVIDKLFGFIISITKAKFGTGWFIYFLQDGLFAGISSVLGFLPQLTIMYIAFGILEHSGYMARISFVFDRLLKKVGLTGKAIFALLFGFGCTTTAVSLTKGLENKNVQRRAICGLGVMTCNAKLPVLLLILSLFFEKYKALWLFVIYCFSFAFALLITFILSKKDKEKEYLILEVPRLCLPKFKTLWQTTFFAIKEFVARIFTTVVSFSILLFVVENFSFGFAYVGANIEESMLYKISQPLTVLFRPLGFSVGIVVALLSGIIAKELVITTFAVVNGVSLTGLAGSLIDPTSNIFFTKETAIAFMIFILVYTPCVAALKNIKTQVGVKQMLKMLVYQFLLAYLLAYAIQCFAKCIFSKNYLLCCGIIILIASVCFVVIKLVKLKSQGGKNVATGIQRQGRKAF